MLEAILIVLVLVGLLVTSVRRPKTFPPGPTLLPVLGNFFSLDRVYPQKSIDFLYERYGPLVGLLLPGFKVVMVGGWQAINEAFLNDDLLGRPDVCLTRDRFTDGENHGIIFLDGDDWRTQRRFTLHHFRNLGFGRKSHLAIIQEEVEALVEYIKGKGTEPFNIQEVLSTSMINMNWALLGGRRFEHSNHDVRKVYQNIQDSLHHIKMFGSVAIGVPFLRYLFPERTGYKSLKKGSEGILEFIQKAVREHDLTREKDTPRDFIDIYFDELQKPDVNPSFSENQLEGICMDLLFAGVDTTISVMSFTILFLCLRKDLQEKIFKEINEHVGTHRFPTLDDKPNLAYTEAIVMEALRLRTPAPTNVPHRAIRDTTLGDYHIPKDTIVIMNLNSVFMDKQYWTDPEVFRPERFLTVQGKVQRDERLIPFGKGKRACLGESLAKSSSFIFMAAIVQSFSFSFDPSLPIPETEGVPGFTMAAPFYKIVATPRI